MGCFGGGSKSAAAGTLDSINPFSATGDAHSRCNHMLKEAAVLAKVGAKYEADLKKLQDAMTATLESGAVVCATPLPSIYMDTQGVAAGALMGATEPIGGPQYRLDTAKQAKGEMGAKIAAETMKPISDWIARYNDCITHQKVVDKAYDALEYARKQVTSQKDKIDKVRGRVASDPKAQAQVASAEAQLQTLAGKLSIAETNHNNLEMAQHQRVMALNKDAISIRAAIRAAFDITCTALTSARDLVSADKEPAPAPPSGTAVTVAGR